MILLTHGYFIGEDLREKQIMKPYVPLGILYISAQLEHEGIEHEVFDSTFSTFEKFKSFLNKKRPRLIGIYTNLMTKLNVLKIISHIRTNEALCNCRIVLGGPEIRFNAEKYLAYGADLLVIGEGEETFAEVCRDFVSTGKLGQGVTGTASMENGKTVFAGERALIKNIDTLPMPARHRVKLEDYLNCWKDHHGRSMLSVSTMRGCPYTCKWCSRAVYGGTYRRRSAALVVEEMSLLKQRYNPDGIWFVDDVFTISHRWLKEFRDELIKRQLRLPYEIITRADRMNDEVISMLKESGCYRVWIGAESGSQRIIDAMDRRVDANQVREMIIRTRKAGMEAGTFIMLGYPGEKRADIRETIRHLDLSRPSEYTITIAYPITGTPLYNEVRDSLHASEPWERITDREYEFQRTRSRQYYDFALKWVSNEVNYLKDSNPLKKIKFKSKSVLAQLLMLVS